jgi:tRNA threonylcarbamoyladenosine biosynthesis protein TsaB
MDNQIVLGIDTSGIICRMAIWSTDRVLYQKTVEAPHLHSTLLAEFVRTGLNELKLRPAQVDLVCITTGPGSFTGLRIGMAYAKGFCFALEKPLVGVSNFEILVCAAAGWERPVYTLIDARRGSFYLGIFMQDIYHLDSVKVIKGSDLLKKLPDAGCIVLDENTADPPGMPAELLNKKIRSGTENGLICQLGFNKFKSGYKEDVPSLEPLYIQSFAGVT